MAWRDRIKVHPAADLFPMMSDAELDDLAADIKKNGLQQPVAVYKESHDSDEQILFDGRNRLDALELLGIPIFAKNGRLKTTVQLEGQRYSTQVLQTHHAWLGLDPYAYVISANIKRRHLTGEQKRELIAKVLALQPEKSDRAIAAVVKADHKTVAAVREKAEASGEIPHIPPTDRVGVDGAKKARKPGIAGSPVDPTSAGQTEVQQPDAQEEPIDDANENEALRARYIEARANPGVPLADGTTYVLGPKGEGCYFDDPEIAAVYAAWAKLKPGKREDAIYSMNAVPNDFYRKAKKQHLGLWAIEKYKVAWLLKHFGVNVKWPEFKAWVGGCGDNNTSVRWYSEPEIIGETVPAAEYDPTAVLHGI